jgi:hypothetical protein
MIDEEVKCMIMHGKQRTKRGRLIDIEELNGEEME